jgi:hypothetical protein
MFARGNRTARVATLIAVAAAACASIGAGFASAAIWNPEPARGIGPVGECPAPSARLAPNRAFTLIYRLQGTWDVERLGNMRADQPATLPIRDRDVFLVRARAESAGTAGDIVDHLTDPGILSGELFRCHRRVSLTGAHTDPGNGEYFNRLGGDPRMWGVAPDWERPFFRLAYPDTAGHDVDDPEPEWTHDFGTTVERLGSRAASIHASGRRAGAVITGAHRRNGWDFGLLAKRARFDYQVVQIQPSCVDAVQDFASRSRELLRMYRANGIPTSRLGVEVSFAQDPAATPWGGDVTAGRAARCTKAAYDVGIRAVLLWAQPEVLDEYFAALPDYIRG